MSRILEEMLSNRQSNNTKLDKDNFFLEKKGDLTIVMVKTTQEEEDLKFLNDRILQEQNLKITRFERVDNEEKIRLTKKGLPDKRFSKKNG